MKMLAIQPDGFGTIFDCDHAVPEECEHSLHRVEYDLFVIQNQYVSSGQGSTALIYYRCFIGQGSTYCRQVDAECGTLPRYGIYSDSASVLGNDGVCRGKPEPRTR